MRTYLAPPSRTGSLVADMGRPRAALHLLDEGGGSLLWTRAREILEALVR